MDERRNLSRGDASEDGAHVAISVAGTTAKDALAPQAFLYLGADCSHVGTALELFTQ